MPVLVLAVCCCCMPASAFGLPAGRVYEQVSPVYKGGYGTGSVLAVAPDGEQVAFNSFGVFGGVLWAAEASWYLARRGPVGWSTSSLQGPPITETVDLSSTFQYALASGSLEESKLSAPTPGSIFLLHPLGMSNTAASWAPVAEGKLIGNGNSEGESTDFCHIAIGHASRALLPEAGVSEEEHHNALYDLASAPAGGCRGAGSQALRLVAVKNQLGPEHEPEPIDRQCIAQPGISSLAGDAQESGFNALSVDGEEVFFTTCTTGSTQSGNSHQLFVRLGGERTLEVSEPVAELEACGELIPCPGAVSRASANFSGASEDGSRAFFTTAASLVTGDEDGANDLYMATIACPQGEGGCEVSGRQVTSLVQVSHDPNPGEAAEVQGVVRVASDGSRVYFVARGVLSEGGNSEGPVRGADNLYVYERDERYPGGHMVFVADLCSGPVRSGLVGDKRCPSDLDEVALGGRNDIQLWRGPIQEAQSTPDGSMLVFASYGQLSRNDTDDAKDIYRFDGLSGTLARVSLGEAGADSNGNRDDGVVEVGGKPKVGSEADASIPNGGIATSALVMNEREMGTRAISANGSRIVFTTAEPLSSEASNGLVNVYEWNEANGGEVSMLSSGSAVLPDRDAVIAPEGRDVFFISSAQLVPQDADEASDIYDVHIGGGPPPVPAERQPCSGDACQGPLTNPAPLLVPGSVSQAPGGNFPAPASKPKAKAKAKKARPGRRRSKRARSGSASRRARRLGTSSVGRGAR